jgi:hypothetical protein
MSSPTGVDDMKMTKLFKADELALELGGRARVARDVKVGHDGTISFWLFNGTTWEVVFYSPENYGARLGLKYLATYATEDGQVIVMSVNA